VIASLVFSQSSAFAQTQVTSPRELLATQPDFVAEEILFSVEKHGAHGRVTGHELLFKKAKKSRFSRTDTGVATFFEDATKPGGWLWFEGGEFAAREVDAQEGAAVERSDMDGDGRAVEIEHARDAPARLVKFEGQQRAPAVAHGGAFEVEGMRNWN
jgi:hypothetical protein